MSLNSILCLLSYAYFIRTDSLTLFYVVYVACGSARYVVGLELCCRTLECLHAQHIGEEIGEEIDKKLS